MVPPLDADAPTTPPGPRKRKLAARLVDQDNVARPVLKQQRVAQLALQHREATDHDNVSNDGGVPTADGTHLLRIKPHPEVADTPKMMIQMIPLLRFHLPQPKNDTAR